MDFDLIHTHERILEADIYTMHGTPHRFWIHEVRKKNMSLYDHATTWVENALIKNTKCRRFLSVSDLTKEKFLQSYNVDPGKVHVVHPGIDMERFRTLNREQCRREIRRFWGIDETDIVILFVSMNFDIKGLDALMAAVARLNQNQRAEKIKLLIVGKGEEKKYRQIAKSLGIDSTVIFAGVQKENLEQIYMASDIFSIISKFDTFGIAVLEAMAASLPVIVCNTVGAKDVVKQGINGFIIEDRTDIDKISEKILFLCNKEMRNEMGMAAYATALDNSWNAAAKKYENFYDELLM